jgi:serine phosphatase RsbU (regulator of sigma subunit)/tetratricopeptide (TPR) repeat protein
MTTAEDVIAIPNCELLGVVGSGTTSTVYRGLREGVDVAVKVMRPAETSTLSELGATLFRKEAVALGRMSHPCLVRVIEAGSVDALQYLIMDFVEGDDLAAEIKAGALAEERLLGLARSLAGALAEVHRHGLIHRDIKPANIIIEPGGTSKLIDFGFVAPVQDLGQPVKNVVVGTFMYGAPEQTGLLDRPTDTRSDLYSLGCVLYECAVGKPPFVAPDVTELLRMHAAVTPKPAHEENAEVRPVVSAIIQKLLRKDPDDRYQTAAALLWDLTHLNDLRDRSDAFRLGSRDGKHQFVHEVPLVGRADELDELTRRWEDARKHGLFVQVEGEGGSGKTRLLRELIRAAQRDGALVLQGKAQKVERTPFGPLREAIEDYLAALRSLPAVDQAAAREKLIAAAGESAAIVRRLSKSLVKLFGDVPEVPPLEAQAEQERFYERVADFFVNIGQQFGSFLLLVDDAQWLDQGTIKILRLISLRFDAAPFLLATTARNDSESRAAADAFHAQIRSDRAARVQLGPLSEQAVRQLVAAFLGGRPLEDSVIARIATRANGNPFAIGQYVRAMFEQGMLTPTETGWVADSEALNEIVLANDAMDLLLGRIGRLSDETRRVLSTAAVVGFTFDATVLSDAARGGHDVVETALQEALAANLIEAGDANRYLFIHDRVVEALLASLDTAQTRDVNQTIADALDRRAAQLAELPGPMVFALARHYANGHAEAHPQRVFETSTAAGFSALESYVYEEAFRHLDRALNVARTTQGIEATPVALLKLREGLGVSCAHTGRLKLALEHLHACLPEASERMHRARLHYLISLVHSTEGNNDPAWNEIQQALSLLGRRMPENRVLQVLSSLFYLVVTYVLFKTGIGFGKAKGEERKRRELTSMMLNAAYLMAYYIGDYFKAPMTSFLRLYNGHFIGISGEHAKSLAAHALLHANMLGGRRTPARLLARAIDISAQLGDKEALAYCRTMAGFSSDYAGLTVRGQEIVRDALPDALKYCLARDAGQYAGAAAVSITNRGRSRESIDRILLLLPVLRRMGVTHYLSNVLGALYVQYVTLGRAREGLGHRAEQVQIAKDMPQIRFVQAFLHCHQMHALYEQQEFGPELNETIDKFLALNFDHYLSRIGYLVVAYIRLEQFLRTEGKNERQQARELLKKAWLTAAFGPPLRCVLSPVHRCHLHAIRATVAREEEQFRLAHRLLAKAEDDASESDTVWGMWGVRRERARLAASEGDDVKMRIEAQRALDLALSEGWVLRANQLRFEFGLEPEKVAGLTDAASISVGSYGYLGSIRSRSTSYLGVTKSFFNIDSRRSLGASTSIASTESASVTRAEFSAQRYFDALLDVSIAASASLDVEQQVPAALDAMVRVLGAERGFLFLADDAGGLQFKRGRDARAADVEVLQGYSSTVVKKAFSEKKGIVVTGTDEGEALGSASAVTHNLRSIIAAPVVVRDRLLGVVYADSTLLKGLFTPSHLGVLVALGNQIGVALETARAARTELKLQTDRTELEKELEVTKAVQAMVLPRESEHRTSRVALRAFYSAANRCGGDWWWYEDEPGAALLMVGDVTGHGAGAAMVCAAAAGSYRTLRRARPDAPVPDLLAGVSETLKELAQGSYLMTMAAIRVELSPGAAVLKVWNAGAPPLFLTRADGRVEVLTAPGAPLGFSTQLGFVERALGTGDRLLVFTDGLIDLLRMRRVRDLCVQMAPLRLDEAAQVLTSALEQPMQSGRDDDITFVVMDVDRDMDAAVMPTIDAGRPAAAGRQAGPT